MEPGSGEGNEIPKNPSHSSLSRRSLLKGAAAAALAANFGYQNRDALFDAAQSVIPSSDSYNIPEPTITPELLAGGPIEFGFNTHLDADPEKNDNLTLERFKLDVDRIAGLDQKWLRLNIWPWEQEQGGSPTDVNWNEQNMAIYDQAIDYATERGLKLCLVTFVPYYAEDYSIEDYLTTTRTYFRDLAERYKGKIDTYQVFNEPNLHHFRDYQKIKRMSDEYIAEFAAVISEASTAIKAVDPEAKVTINPNKWRDSGRNLVEEGTRLCDAVKDVIDVITLDLYPFDDARQIEDLPKYVAYFKDRYQKPVIIGELGMPTEGFDDFDIEKQAEYVPKAIEALKHSQVKPAAIILYEITDWSTGEGAAEQNYGILEPDGTPKKSYEAIIDAMQPEKSQEKDVPAQT